MVIHKVQKTRTKVLPSAMTGEYIVLYLSKTENIYSKLKISLNFVAPCEYLNFTDTYHFLRPNDLIHFKYLSDTSLRLTKNR